MVEIRSLWKFGKQIANHTVPDKTEAIQNAVV
jgi:hypothetical protein